MELVELVWSAIADTHHRHAWWSYLDLDARPGGQLGERWRGAGGAERDTRGQVLVAEPDTSGLHLARSRLER